MIDLMLMNHIAAAARFNKGGGGAGSGSVDYPAYLKDHHARWLESMEVAVDSATTFLSTNMITNPRFDKISGTFTEDYGWTYGSGWSFGDPYVTGTAIDDTGTKDLLQAASFIGTSAGTYYVEVSCGAYTSGDLEIYFGDVKGTDDVSAIGVIGNTIVTTSTAPILKLTGKAASAFTGTIEHVGVYQLATSPYDPTAISIFDPNAAYTYVDDSLLDATQDKYNLYGAIVTALAPQTDWETYIEAAKDRLDTSGYISDVTFDSTEIDSVVDTYEARQKEVHLKSVSRLAAGMAMGGAINSSQYPVAVGQLERGHSRQVGDFRSQMTLKAEEMNFGSEMDKRTLRLNLMSQSAQIMMSSLQFKAESARNAALTQAEINRVAMAAETEFDDKTQAYAVKDATWDLDVFAPIGNLMAAIGGGTVQTPAGMESGKGTTGSAIGGAIAGIGAGAGLMGMTSVGMTAGTAATATAPAVAAAMGPTGWAILGLSAIAGGISGGGIFD